MERFSVIFFSLCFLAIVAESTSIESSTTIETLWNNAHDGRNVEDHANLLKQKNIQNNTKHLLLDENLNITQVGEHAKNPLYLNKTSEVSTTSTGYFSSSDMKDTQHLKHNQEDDANHKNGPSIGLLSHDILEPGLITARLSRQAEKSDSNLASIENHRISNDVTTNNYNENRRVVPSKSNTSLESDLGVAEDRYQSPYPYWNPYYRGQFPNQRYQANYRREPYRNYWRYPVFPGK